MGVAPLIRQGVLGASILFSAIVLAISAHLLSQIQQYYLVTTVFEALGVAIAAISLVTLPVMLVVDILRRGAFTSMIVVEFGWLSVLWILWVATAGETVYGYGLNFPFGCIYVDPVFNGMCQETQVIEAFSFINFIILLLYTSFLIVTVIIAASRGQSIWLSSVKESFGSPAGPVGYPMNQHNASASPQLHVHPNSTGIPQYVPGGLTLGGPAIGV